MNCLLVSCRVLNFFPETHETAVSATNAARVYITILFMTIKYLYYNNLPIKILLSSTSDEAKIRKSGLSFSKHKGIIIVIFAGYFSTDEY
jgi:hypothetical protein